MENSRCSSASQHDLRYKSQSTNYNTGFATYGRQSKHHHNKPDVMQVKNFVAQQASGPTLNNFSKTDLRASLQSQSYIHGRQGHVSNSVPPKMVPRPPPLPRTTQSHIYSNTRYSNSQELGKPKALHLDNLFRVSPTELLSRESSHSREGIHEGSSEEVIIEENISLSYFRDEDSEASDDLYDEPTGLGLKNTNSLQPVVEEPFLAITPESTQLRDSLAQSHRTVGTLSSELSRAQFHITELTTKLKSTTVNQNDLTDKLKSVTIRCIQAERHVTEISEEKSQLLEMLSTMEEMNKKLEAENAQLSIELQRRKIDWDSAIHRSQVRERATYAQETLDRAVQDARSGLMTLLKGVDGIKQVSSMLSTLDNFYTQPISPTPDSKDSDFAESPTLD